MKRDPDVLGASHVFFSLKEALVIFKTYCFQTSISLKTANVTLQFCFCYLRYNTRVKMSSSFSRRDYYNVMLLPSMFLEKNRTYQPDNVLVKVFENSL